MAQGSSQVWGVQRQEPEINPHQEASSEGHGCFPSFIRCFSFGLGPACHQLLHGLSALSRGQAYFLRPGERLQPMVSLSLGPVFRPWKSFSQVTLSLRQNPIRSRGLLAPRPRLLPHFNPYSPLRCQRGGAAAAAATTVGCFRNLKMGGGTASNRPSPKY